MRAGIVSTYPPYPCGIAEYTHFLVEELLKVPGLKKLTVFANTDEVKEPTLTGEQIRKLGAVERFSALRKGILKLIAQRIKAMPHFIEEDAGNGKKLNVMRVFSVRSKNWDSILEALRTEGEFDVIHVQHEYGIFGTDMSFVEILKELKRYCRRLVVTLHTVLSKENEFSKIQSEIISTSDLVIVHSDICFHELWKQSVDISKVKMVWHGTYPNSRKVSFRRFASIIKNSSGKDVPRKSFKVVLPGFLRWDKGIDLLGKICEILRKDWSDTVVIVTGIPQAQGNELKMIQERVKELEEKMENVIFLRKFLSKDELMDVLAGADAILLPYNEWPGHTGVSGALHLAIGSAKPIIASAVPRVAEYLMLFPELTFAPGDPDSFAKTFSYLRKNYARIKREVSAELERYAQKTSWRSVARRHFQLWQELFN